MPALLTKRIIKQLCGPFYERGEAAYDDKKVSVTHREANAWELAVQGVQSSSEPVRVSVVIDRDGDVDAHCSCLAFSSYDKYCQHVAASLLAIMEREQASGQTASAPARKYPSLLHPENQPLEDEEDAPPEGQLTPRYSVRGGTGNTSLLADSMLSLFARRPVRTGGSDLLDTREPLELEVTCKLYSYGVRKQMFGIELRVGPGRLYIVQKIRDFLEALDSGKPFLFGKHFTYDPARHRFPPGTDEIIRQLIQAWRSETIHQAAASRSFFHAAPASGDRLLPIPPAAWGSLEPLLAAAPNVKLVHLGQTYDGLQLSGDAAPLSFALEQAQDAGGYRLDIHGLDRMTVLEDFALAVSDGTLYKLPPDACIRLSELKYMLPATSGQQVGIAPGQIEPFMEKVVPGLMKLGSVKLAESVADRIYRTRLQAKLYLDRIRDRLVAGLEFQYGDIVINPLAANRANRVSDRILLRDGEQERRILELMEQSPFATTEEGYFMEDEEAEFEFLYETVPQLEKLLTVYATTAVKVRVVTKHAPPSIKVDVGDRTDWLEFRFSMDGIPESEIRSLVQSLEIKRKYYRLPDGSLMPLDTAEFQEIIRFLNEVGISLSEVNGPTFRIPAVRALHLTDADESRRAVKLGKSFRRLLVNMRNPDNLDFTVPDSLAPVLRDYQKYGFQWMKTLAHYQFGGILADDMGLGKTVQAISFLVSVLPEIREKGRPALIVCPASLVYNWFNELKRFAPGLKAVIADGGKAERNGVLKRAREADAIITSYPLLRRDVAEYAKLDFHTLILDEAQSFKNHSTQTAQAVKALEAQYRFALTGTPVENKLEELWSIFAAVFPELFPSRKAFGELTRDTVARRVRPFLLRRLKGDVLQELPDKIESVQASELLPEQKRLYVSLLAKLQQETVKHLDADDFQKHRIKILAGITRLRQVCCHPALFVEDYKGSSAKFEQLLEMLEECRSSGKRVLIFSQFTEMLRLIGRELGYMGAPFFYLDGQTPAAERVELCRRFNEGERELFLLSLKAGGTGLNLTGADTVILYDLWWNPAVEQQAADRAHRIGQKNVVQVIRLVTQGTVEDKMYELQQKKKNMIDEVIQPGQEALSSLTEQDIREILMIE